MADQTTADKKAKREKFIELATKRTNKAIAAIKTIGGLANTKNYEFTTADAASIHTALNEAIVAINQRFDDAISGKTVSAPSTFTLRSNANG